MIKKLLLSSFVLSAVLCCNIAFAEESCIREDLLPAALHQKNDDMFVQIPNKPDPTSSNEIVKMMGFNKEEVLYMGDSESDVKTAKNANLKCIGCEWGFRDYKTLVDAGADYIVKEPKEVLSIL